MDVLGEGEHRWHQAAVRLGQLKHGHVAPNVEPHHLGDDLPTVGQTDHHLVGIIDHVGVGDDPTPVVKDDAGTVTGLGDRDQHHRVNQRFGHGDHRLVARIVDRRLGEQTGHQ